MFECPNCGGNIKFDISSQMLACEYCDTHVDPYAFEKKTSDGIEGSAPEDYEVTIFTCPQCGGEILSTDNTAAGFCSFCGASTILYSRIAHEHRPNYIIPFQKTKEDCKQSYAAMMRKAIFAPNALKDPAKIDSFRGIYMPYWAFYITQQGPISLAAEKSHRRGDYIITSHYKLSGDINAYYKGLSYDASSSFYDSISETIAPYDVKGMEKFTPAFLSGFYADISDVPSEVYRETAEMTAFDQSYEQIVKTPEFRGFSLKTVPENPAQFHTATREVDQAMFPVWFMSYRNGDRVAYATVNGQSGKVVADLPVDIRKFLSGSLLVAIPLFLLFTMFSTLIPSTMLTLCGVIALITIIMSHFEIRHIIRRENHEDDMGLLFKKAPEKLEKRRAKSSIKKKSSSKGGTLVLYIFIGYMISMFFPLLLAGVTELTGSAFLWVILVVAALIFVIISFQKIKEVPGKKGSVGLATALGGILLGAFVAFAKPVSDLYYYGAAIVLLLGVFFTERDLIEEYNLLSTHALPQFDRQGGDDRA